MKKLLILAVTSAFLGLLALGGAQADLLSLRGALKGDANSEMFDKKRVVTKEGGFKRTWKLQPPSIPHKISKERINLEENTCMRCHSAENFKKEKAVKVGDSHFKDAMGKVQKDLNGRRYFCTLCHMTQVDANPLVENVFAGQ